MLGDAALVSLTMVSEQLRRTLVVSKFPGYFPLRGAVVASGGDSSAGSGHGSKITKSGAQGDVTLPRAAIAPESLPRPWVLVRMAVAHPKFRQRWGWANRVGAGIAMLSVDFCRHAPLRASGSHR